jgi:hypothetical protein
MVIRTGCPPTRCRYLTSSHVTWNDARDVGEPAAGRDEDGDERRRLGVAEADDLGRLAPEVVRLRVVPTGATYVCIDDGRDNVRFEGTLAQARTFRGRRVRISTARFNCFVPVTSRRRGRYSTASSA